MKYHIKTLIVTCAACVVPIAQSADTVAEALKASTVKGKLNLRYEDVNNNDDSSDQLSLSSRITVTSADYKGWSATLGLEDVRDVLGIDDEGGLIADPETSEVDQAYFQYKNDNLTAKIGRQVITYDNHRFVGHVAWRQDQQTFDGATISWKANDNLKVDGAYVVKRNRIFAEDGDFDSNDFYLNANYNFGASSLVGYSYLLDNDDLDIQSNTFGLRYAGKSGGNIQFLYTAEYAIQSSEQGEGDFDTDYFLLEAGVTFKGITAKLGFESLGSDDGEASFVTPLSTLHAHNGWSDVLLGGQVFPENIPSGLEDTYISLATNIKGFGLSAIYHDFSLQEGSGDHGSEVNFQVTRSLGGGFSAAVKYADFSSDSALPDRDILWTWVSYSF